MALTKEIVLDPILSDGEQEKFFRFLKNVIKDGSQSCCIIYGPAGSGKSTLARVAKQVVGSEKCINIPSDIQNLCKTWYGSKFQIRMRSHSLGIVIQEFDDNLNIESVVAAQKNEFLPKHMIVIRSEELARDSTIDRHSVIINCSLTLNDNDIWRQIHEPQPKLIQEILLLVE